MITTATTATTTAATTAIITLYTLYTTPLPPPPPRPRSLPLLTRRTQRARSRTSQSSGWRRPRRCAEPGHHRCHRHRHHHCRHQRQRQRRALLASIPSPIPSHSSPPLVYVYSTQRARFSKLGAIINDVISIGGIFEQAKVEYLLEGNDDKVGRWVDVDVVWCGQTLVVGCTYQGIHQSAGGESPKP